MPVLSSNCVHVLGHSINPSLLIAFLLDTVGCQCGIRAVLSRIHKDGTEQVIAFASRAMSKSERENFVTRQELLAAFIFILNVTALNIMH